MSRRLFGFFSAATVAAILQFGAAQAAPLPMAPPLVADPDGGLIETVQLWSRHYPGWGHRHHHHHGWGHRHHHHGWGWRPRHHHHHWGHHHHHRRHHGHHHYY